MKKTGKLLILMSALILLLSGCIQPEVENNRKPEVIPYHKETAYSYRTQVQEDILTTNGDPSYLLLVNKEHPLGNGFEPNNLVSLTCPTYGGKEILLESRAAMALTAMLAEMRADGVSDVSVTSGYRSYSYQSMLFDQYVNDEGRTISSDAVTALGENYVKAYYLDRGITRLTYEDARRVVLSYSAEPGKSEHQSGLCVDLVSEGAVLTRSFENTQAFRWLSDHAYRFGFILRYPNGREDVTGYSYEPWHYRFVGREAATDIRFGNLTLEEYLLANASR